MPEGMVEIFRTPLVLTARPRRRTEERLAMRFPRALRVGARLVWRLPARSRLRRALIRRAVRSAWEALNRRDLDMTFALYHPQCKSVYPADFTPVGFEPGTHDLETRIRSQGRIIDEWEGFHFEGDELIQIGRERLITTGRMKAVGPGSGAPVETPWVALLETRDGQVVREILFVDRSAAFEALGIPALAAQVQYISQQVYDRNYDDRQGTLAARMRAVVGAQRAVAHGEPNAAYALRQSLVDLAAVAELIADELPAPRVS